MNSTRAPISSLHSLTTSLHHLVIVCRPGTPLASGLQNGYFPTRLAPAPPRRKLRTGTFPFIAIAIMEQFSHGVRSWSVGAGVRLVHVSILDRRQLHQSEVIVR